MINPNQNGTAEIYDVVHAEGGRAENVEQVRAPLPITKASLKRLAVEPCFSTSTCWLRLSGRKGTALSPLGCWVSADPHFTAEQQALV